MYIVYSFMTAGEIFLNTIFFPFYIIALPFIILWNAVPDAFLAWAVSKDFEEEGYTGLNDDNDFYLTVISAAMLFVDSSYYLGLGLLGFVTLFGGSILALGLFGLFLWLVGVSLPIILYTVASLMIAWSFAAMAFFLLLVFGSPFILGTAGLFILVPWIMW